MNYSYTTRNITYMQQKTYDNSIKFGKRVKELRLSVKELRLKSCKSLNNFVMTRGGLSTATWSRIENGVNDIKLSTIIKVAALLNISVGQLMKDIDFDYSIDE